MPLIFKDWIVRSDLRNNPDQRFVFGDNIMRTGLGGQAKEMRGEPNAIGVVTKWAPSMRPGAFFYDTDECIDLVQRDLLLVQQALDAGRTVVVPDEGIGTGLARLEIHAPNLNHFIGRWFRTRT